MSNQVNSYEAPSDRDGDAQTLNEGGPWRIFKNALCVFIFISAFIVSKEWLSIYTSGDQIYYTKFYTALSYSPIESILYLQMGHIGNADPLFGIIMWIGAQFVEKNTYVSVFNAAMCALLFMYLSKNKVPFWAYPLFFTNFYLIVVFTSAERLKFSIIFVLLFVLVDSRSRYIAAVASVFVHVQNLILYVSFIFKDISKYIYKAIMTGRLDLRQSLTIIGSLLAVLFIFYISFDTILSKFTSYQSLIIEDSISLLLLLTITMMVVRDKGDAILTMIPIVFASYVLGGSRVNMIGVMVFIYLVVRDRRCSHPVFIAAMAFFSYKSIAYLDSMYMYGDGFIGLSNVL